MPITPTSRALTRALREASGGSHGIPAREVLDRLAGLGEGAGHVVGAVDPHDQHRRIARGIEPVRHIRGDVSGVVALQAGDLTANLDLAFALEQDHLLAAVMAVARRAAPGGETGGAGGENPPPRL